MKNNNYICHVPFLRNSKAYDHDFLDTGVKWWYQGFFFIFMKFWFIGLLGGVKEKSIVQNENNNYNHHMSYLWNSIAYDQDFCCTFVKWWYLQAFFPFHFWYFHLSGGVKGWKMTEDDKKNSVCHTSYLRNHTSYVLDLWYTCVKG